MTEERELVPLVLNPPPNVIKVLDAIGVEKLLEFLETHPEFGYDVETTPHKDFYWRRMRTMQFGNNEVQYVIDLKSLCNNSGDLLFECQGEYGKHLHKAPALEQLIIKLQKYLCSDKWTKVGTNLGFEYECLYWMFGIRSYGFYDCMLAEKCLYAGLGGKASLKNYDFYSLESMTERYFGFIIDKTLQTSFNLEGELTDAQYEYAALDTRLPLGIKTIQTLIASGETSGSLIKKGKLKLSKYLDHLDPLIFGDVLHEPIKIENEAIGAFMDMRLHGERIDTEKWKARTLKNEGELKIVIEKLDAIFLPLVGSKNEPINDALIDQLEIEWKQIRDTPTDEEINLKLHIKQMKKTMSKPGWIGQTETLMGYEFHLAQLENTRKEKKEEIKKQHRELKSKRTKINDLKEKCEGEALINYSSNAQLLTCIKENFKQLEKIESLDDETLEKYENYEVIKLIRDYHGLSKKIGTYGYAWAMKWITHPCKEEGWLNPGDGRLHPNYNQYDADTGRSSSSNPNGQNLENDVEVRSCFIADPPDESIRISNCCEAESQWSYNGDCYYCGKCDEICSTYAEEYVIVTADMSGAELRIIAEDSGDPQWINAFSRGEDLHSVGTELLYPEEWKSEALPDCKYYFKLHDEESVAKYPEAVLGSPKKEKCKCPKHKERRDDTKACNFLLAYGGGPVKLAESIKKPLKIAKKLMAMHELKNPGVWKYLNESGKKAATLYKAFDLYGRRRILPKPTQDRAIANCQEYNEKKLLLSDEECEKNINYFIEVHKRKPTADEKFDLTHRMPNANEIGQSYYQMSNSIERKGKNMRIQGTNASIAKVAMGCGYDQNGEPFLWHVLPQYRAKLLKFVHDELVVQCPKRYGKIVAQLIGDSFKRAAALRMKKVIMEFDFIISYCWSK